MDPITLGLIFGGGSALAKLFGAKSANQQRKEAMELEADIAPYAPFLNRQIKTDFGPKANVALEAIGSGLGGFGAGASLAQGLNASEADTALSRSLASKYDKLGKAADLTEQALPQAISMPSKIETIDLGSAPIAGVSQAAPIKAAVRKAPVSTLKYDVPKFLTPNVGGVLSHQHLKDLYDSGKISETTYLDMLKGQ